MGPSSRRRPAAVAGSLLAAALAVAGCGFTRASAPDVTAPQPWHGNRTIDLPAAGVHLLGPLDWTLRDGESPLLFALSSGTATVAMWRYPRTEPLPADHAALADARRRLLGAARARDARLSVIRARLRTVRGARAVEIAAVEHFPGGAVRRVRSLHVYAHGAELVLEALAPPAAWRTTDQLVFSPLERTLRLTRPAGG